MRKPAHYTEDVRPPASQPETSAKPAPPALEQGLNEDRERERAEIRGIVDDLLQAGHCAGAAMFLRQHIAMAKDPEWKGFCEELLSSVREHARRRFEAISAEANELLRKGEAGRAAAILDAAGSLGFEELDAELAALRRKAEPPAPSPEEPPPEARPPKEEKPPPPAPKPPPPSAKPRELPREEQAEKLQRTQEEAIRLARGRSYGRALDLLEFLRPRITDPELRSEIEFDLRAIREAQRVFLGAGEKLGGLPRGCEVSLRVLEDGQRERTVKGELASAGATGLFLLESRAWRFVPFSSLAGKEVVRWFDPASDDDRTAAGYFYMVDGELTEAEKLLGSVPVRYRGRRR